MGVSAAGELLRGEHEQKRSVPRHAGQKREEEAEGGRQVSFACGRDLMYCAEGEGAVRKMVLQLRQAELQAAFFIARQTLQACETATQVGDDLGASGAQRGRVGQHSGLFSAQMGMREECR